MITSHEPIFTTGLSPEEITPQAAAKFIYRHSKELPHLLRLERYYSGDHDINGRKKKNENLSNNKLVINHAAYIANFSSAYLLGEPVKYTSEKDIEQLKELLKKADAATQDSDLALDAAIYGRAYELVYMSRDEVPYPKLARISPLNAFVVYDDTVEQNPVFGVYYFPVYDDYWNISKYKGSLVTAVYIQDIEISTAFTLLSAGEPVPHPFGMVPLDEIYNNGQRFGDFECVMSLIDAVNTLQSDRVNDKEQFVNALLLIKGGTLGELNEERLEAYNALKEQGYMELPQQDMDASFLTRQFDEGGAETLQKSIVSDIHKISCVPDLTDESFAGNSSGVAIKYKLLGLEQITKVKERYFTEGLRYRLRLFANVLSVKGAANIDVSEIAVTFKRSLPANDTEQAQMVSMLSGIAPQRDLLAQLSFISDADKAVEAAEEEKQRSIQRQTEAMLIRDMNTPLDKGDK